MAKVRVKINLLRKVARVISQISRSEAFFSDSREMCIPMASERESAMAMVSKPPRMATREPAVPAFRPMMSPRVVMTLEVSPKPMPARRDFLRWNMWV